MKEKTFLFARAMIIEKAVPAVKNDGGSSHQKGVYDTYSNLLFFQIEILG